MISLTSVAGEKAFRTKENPMSRAAISVFVYSIFLIGQGLVLLLIPNAVLGSLLGLRRVRA
jgi:hypothetical protein